MSKIDRIEISFIPHEQQRYSTCGDWYFEQSKTENVLVIKVSKMDDFRSALAVALHEFAEVIMCDAVGITQEQVDKFDMTYEKLRAKDDESEPGDHASAPYFVQHGHATAIERIVTTQMGLPWPDHEENIGKLFE
jgi:hypothetical protein